MFKNHLANIITSIRILSAIALFFCPFFSIAFYSFYFLGGISDIFDGYIARKLKTETDLGAKLDTIADIVFFGIVLIKMVRALSFSKWLIIWIIGIALIKCINIISGFVISGHFVSEHTVLNKITGVLLFAVPLWPVTLMFVITCTVATIAAVQESHCIRIRTC